MEIHSIRDRTASPDRFSHDALNLVDAVGRPAFPAHLFGAVRKATGCDHVSAFAFDGRRAPRIVLAENTGEPRLASEVAEKYVARYWHLDPANRIFDKPAQANGCLGLRIAASDITDSIYRGHCYTSVGLDHRLSISQYKDGMSYRLNVYCSRSRPFSENAANEIFEASTLLMALLRRHDSGNDAIPAAPISFQQRLSAVCPDLPKRELEVTALIARGLSSQGIALELGISINTVLTYRKRAYTRLNISTQNELMRLLLGPRAAAN